MGRDPLDLHLPDRRPRPAGEGVAALPSPPGTGGTGKRPLPSLLGCLPLGGPRPEPTRGLTGAAPALQQCGPGPHSEERPTPGTAPTAPPEPCAAGRGRPRRREARGPAADVPAPPARPGARARLTRGGGGLSQGRAHVRRRGAGRAAAGRGSVCCGAAKNRTAEEAPRPSGRGFRGRGGAGRRVSALGGGARRGLAAWGGAKGRLSGGGPSALGGGARAGLPCMGRGREAGRRRAGAGQGGSSVRGTGQSELVLGGRGGRSAAEVGAKGGSSVRGAESRAYPLRLGRYPGYGRGRKMGPQRDLTVPARKLRSAGLPPQVSHIFRAPGGRRS